ncbi:MAG TPA: efflux transporter outer membrane subunit [Polyangiaceae bacterium]|nr:efflux transporter outer membrane subunit [Polyangiaceae bacterium]
MSGSSISRVSGLRGSRVFSRPAIQGLLVSAFVAATLSACSLAPKYEVPQVQDVTAYKEAGEWAQATPADTAARGDWWKAFGDPKLDELQTQLHEGSQDLRAAIARFDQARALSLGARSNLFPTVNANAQATRGRTSGNAPASTGIATGNDFVANLELAWEIDLFGRLRNAAAAAGDRAQASAADLAAVELALRSELATDYFSLRGADATIRLLEDTVTAYSRAYDLTKNRYDGGIAAATDVDQAETLRQNALSQLAEVRLQRAQFEHAIAVLLGQPASRFTLEPASLASNPPPVDTGLPSALLLRRPDVASAERAVAAANAEIGVARAAWFPVFSLGASGGYESAQRSTWFDAPSKFWAAGPAAVLPLLDAGGRYAGNKQARAAYDEAVANYRKTALVAYQEVEDNLAALRHLADELAADEAAAASAQRSAYHADRRYASGVADYLEVTSTQTAALQAQRSALDARVRRLNAAVGLVRALGGGWSREQLDHPTL